MGPIDPWLLVLWDTVIGDGIGTNGGMNLSYLSPVGWRDWDCYDGHIDSYCLSQVLVTVCLGTKEPREQNLHSTTRSLPNFTENVGVFHFDMAHRWSWTCATQRTDVSGWGNLNVTKWGFGCGKHRFQISIPRIWAWYMLRSEDGEKGTDFPRTEIQITVVEKS